MLGCEVVIKKIYRHLKSKQKNIHKNLEQKKYALLIEDEGIRSYYKSEIEKLNFTISIISASELIEFSKTHEIYEYNPDSRFPFLEKNQLINAIISLYYYNIDFLLISDDLSEVENEIFVENLDNNLIYRKSKESLLKNVNLILDNHKIIFLPTKKNQEKYKLKKMIIKGIPSSPIEGIQSKIFYNRIFQTNNNKIFVFPMYMAVGGVERNTIEIMKKLKGSFNFITINFEKTHKKQGSLHRESSEESDYIFEFSEIVPRDKYLELLDELKKKFNPEIAWICNGSPWFVENAFKFRNLLSNIPIIDQEVYDTNEGWINSITSKGIKDFDRFIAINQKIKEIFINEKKIPKEKIDLIYSAIDSDKIIKSNKFIKEELEKKYEVDPNKFNVAFLGRLTDQKQPLDFLKIAKLSKSNNDGINFILVGNGELKTECIEYIEKNSLTNVSVIEYIENISEFYNVLDLLIIVSKFEGLPIVSIEAMAKGVPILSTDVGDIRVFLEKYNNGVIFKNNILKDRYEQLLDLKKNYLVYKENSKGARVNVLNFFSSENIMQLYSKSFSTGFEKYKGVNKMNQKPLISVIIPSYNHEKYIAKAIESVLYQTYENFELIIVDDGSKDNSRNIINSYSDSRIKFVEQENKGAHNAINHGISLSKGEYITILNSDDEFMENRFEKILPLFDKYDFVATYIELIDEKNKILGIKEGFRNLEPWPVENPNKTFKTSNNFKKNLVMSNFISTTSNMIFKREVYEKVGGMRNFRYVHDWDFALRVSEDFSMYLLEEPLMKYRLHNTNTISSNRKWMLFEIILVFIANIEKSYKLFYSDDYEKSIFELLESMNFQGNDRLVWIIKVFIESSKEQGVKNPEEILLDNIELREKFLRYVIE